MSRLTGLAVALAAFMTLGLTNEAYSQERAKLSAAASCIDAQGKYVIIWTLTLTLGEQETAAAETPMSDFDGLDLIGQPQGDNYPFSAEAGNIFATANGRLKNGANVVMTPIDTRIYNPETLQATGRIVASGGSTDVDVTVTRPAPCAA